MSDAEDDFMCEDEEDYGLVSLLPSQYRPLDNNSILQQFRSTPKIATRNQM